MPADFYDQTPDGRVVATEATMNTVRTADLLLDRIGRLLRPIGVSQAGGLALGLLRDRGPMSPTELGRRMIVTRATVTGVVDSLEKRGFARRARNPDDRRSLSIEITPEGLETLKKVRITVHAGERAWMSQLSDTELRKLIALLHRVQDSLEASGDAPDGSPPPT